MSERKFLLFVKKERHNKIKDVVFILSLIKLNKKYSRFDKKNLIDFLFVFKIRERERERERKRENLSKITLIELNLGHELCSNNVLFK